MHELAICQDIIAQVEAIALNNNALSVAVINLQIGPLSGVEISLLTAAFSIACSGTLAEQAELKIEALPIRVKCNVCQSESVVAQNKLVCKQCGNWQTQLISGDEMLLRQVELETADKSRQH
mgnify:CR=1 FL=1